jgi:hypothetical protein
MIVAKLVPNPLYEDLANLHSQLQGDASTLSSPLKSAVQMMAGGNGDTWTGPEAQAWAGELSGRSSDCARQVSNMLDAIEAAMASTPKEVTEQQAMGIGKMLALESRLS